MHVFLTGDRQVGKSRAVNGALALLGRPVYGFRTRFLTRERGSSSLYITPANDPENFSEDSMVAELRDGKMRPLSDRFDALGSALLREARLHPEGVILMDECGHLEKNALVFQDEIRACLDGDIPVLGVLRKDQAWHQFIKEHPRVTVITVDESNRGDMAQRVAALIMHKKEE
ncbi:MAG: nucleotide kinase [Clostridia bacterium]|nr:nucleotide kinase [Clostridia bacterium]